MLASPPGDVPDSSKVFRDTVFYNNNKHITETWVPIKDVYSSFLGGRDRLSSFSVIPLLPEKLSLEQFSQGAHYECLVQSLLAVLIRFPHLLKRCFLTKNLRVDGRYTFQFFRGKEWVMVEIDDTIPLENGEILYMRSPTEHWWPLLLEKAYAKFYTAYDHLEGCTLQEAFHDFTGNPVLNIPMERKLAQVMNVDITSSDYWLSVGEAIRCGDYAASVLTKDMPLEQYGIQSDQYYTIVDIFAVTRNQMEGGIGEEEQVPPSVGRSVVFLKEGGPSAIHEKVEGSDQEESKPKEGQRRSMRSRRGSLARTGVALRQLVVKLYNPFEDDEYCGPLCPTDSFWGTVVLLKTVSTSSSTVEKYLTDVSSSRYIHLPFMQFLQWMAYVQLCLLGVVEEGGTYFFDEWREYTAGGSPMYVTWRNNPIYLLQNKGPEPMSTVVSLIQEDQRRFTAPDECTKYVQCGMTVSQCMHSGPAFPTLWITHNNHRAIQKSLFFNSREVTMKVTIPPSSTCYLIPSTMNKGTEAHFLLGFYRLRAQGSYRNFSISKLFIPSVPFFSPLQKTVELMEQKCARLDFSVSGPCEMHLLVQQKKPYVSKSGGDSKGQDYIGVYLYNASSERVTSACGDGATNYREIGLLHNLPSAGRYTIAITCPKMNSAGPAVEVQVLLACSPPRLQQTSVNSPKQPEVGANVSFASSSTSIAAGSSGAAQPAWAGTGGAQWIDAPEASSPIHELLSLVYSCHVESEGFWPPHTPEIEESKASQESGKNMRDDGQHISGAPLFEAEEEDMGSVSTPFSKKYYQWERTTDAHRIRRTRAGDGLSGTCGEELRATLQSWADATAGMAGEAKSPTPHEGGRKGSTSMRGGGQGGAGGAFLRLLPSSRDRIEESSYHAMKRRLERMKQEPLLHAEAIKRLEAELEKADKAYSSMKFRRFSYLKESYEGRPAQVLLLEEDHRFIEAEQEYAFTSLLGEGELSQLSLQALHERAACLAHRMNEEERKTYLTEKVDGIPLNGMLNDALDKDEIFRELEMQRAEVMNKKVVQTLLVHSCPSSKNNSVSEVDKFQSNKTVEMESGRDSYLEEDKEVAKRKLEEKLSQRAKEIAKGIHNRERGFLGKEVSGYPLDALALNEDEKVLSLEQAARITEEKTVDSTAKEAQLRVLHQQIQARVTELAWAARKKYLDAKPVGIPLEELNLANEPSFLEKEAHRRELMQKIGASLATKQTGTSEELLQRRKLQEELREIDGSLKEMLTGIAMKRVIDTEYFLPPEPEGVKLCYIPFAKDPKFCELEAIHKALKASSKANTRQIEEAEEKMLRRVEELAQKVKMADLEGLPETFLGVPLRLLEPHKDPRFNRCAEELRELKKNPDKAAEVAHLREKMNYFLLSIGEAYYARDRAYLNQEPLGVPISLLYFHNDNVFRTKEVTRMKLKLEDARRNAPMIRQLETELNARAIDIAKAHIQAEMEGLLHNPEELPRALLNPYEDPIFRAEVQKMRELTMYNSSKPEVAPIKEAMNRRLTQLARQLLESDRGFLIPDPKGVPFSLLPFATDPEFRLTEARRMILKIDNELRNAEQIKDLEDKLNRRAAELAEAQLRLDMQGMDREPEGIPLPVLKLHNHPEFKELVYIHRMTTSAPDRESAGRKMNELAHRVARNLRLQRRKEVLEPFPEGVPLELLPLDTDDTYRQLEIRCTHLHASFSELHGKAIEELGVEMNKRARELAMAQKEEDLRGVDPTPMDIPLNLLQPHEDAKMKELIEFIREAKKGEEKGRSGSIMGNLSMTSGVYARRVGSSNNTSRTSSSLAPTGPGSRNNRLGMSTTKPLEDSVEVKKFQEKMSERARELAKVWLVRDYLNPSQYQVPLDVLPLDTDTEFHSLEVERAIVRIKEGNKAAKKIKALEEKLSLAVKRMVKAQMEQDLASVPDMVSYVPKYVIDLHGNPQSRKVINELRAMRRDPEKNKETIEFMERELNGIAEFMAAHLRSHNRSYLASHHLGIPLGDLPLDADEVFKTLEGRRAALKLSRPVNTIQISAIEISLNDRCAELARNVMDEDLQLFKPEYEGIPIQTLHPHENIGFREAAERLRRQKRDPSLPRDVTLKRLAEAILSEMAMEKKYGEHYFLDSCPEGLPIEEIPFTEDQVFQELMKKRQSIRSSTPLEHRDIIFELEEKMNERTVELAKKVLDDDFDEINPTPLGIPLELLKPRSDAEILRLIPQLRRAKKTAYLKNRKSALLRQINDRVQELAVTALREGRSDYLDAEPAGVPLQLLDVEKDAEFSMMQLERTVRRLQHRPEDKELIKDLEHRLNLRVRELAHEQLERDLQGLDPNPEGVPLKLVNPHADNRFASLVAENRLLKRDKIHNAEQIRQHQEVMSVRTKELAHQLLKEHRGFLDPEPLGVPLSELPLERDPEFHALEVEHLTETLSRHPDKGKVMHIQMKLTKRLKELAEQQRENDLAGIDPFPLGVPLSLLNVHDDEKFTSFVPEVRRLRKDLTRNSGKLQALREKIDERVKEMAESFLKADRQTYLDETPAGIPWSELHLERHSEFKKLENKKLALHVKQPSPPHEEIEEIEVELNKIAFEIALNCVRNDRHWLAPFPEGVSIAVLPLDTDPIFSELELARSAAKAHHAQMLVTDLEDQLNARAQELARDKKMEELSQLNQNPLGIPLATIRPYDDPEFLKLMQELRELQAFQERDEGWEESVCSIRERLNARVVELCDQLLSSDRGYLQPKPSGVPLRYLYLDEDPVFRSKEALRLTLKLDDPKNNALRVLEMEEQLNDRAVELAKQLKEKDLEGLNPTCKGIPIKIINLHKDEAFLNLIESKRRIPPNDLHQEHPIIVELNDLIQRIVDGVIKSDRDYLPREPEGIFLSTLPLDTDEAFTGMEVERTILKATDAKRNAGLIMDLEAQLNARAHELAYDVLAADRPNYLDPKPEELSLSNADLHYDVKFHQMEVDRARLKAKDFASNMQRIRELEIRLNDRVAELGKKLLEEDLFGLDRYPEGYPLSYLSPHTDEQFARWVPVLREAKKSNSVTTLHEIQELLNDRAHALAKERIIAERAFLNPMPEGVPLTLLPLDTDPEFSSMEKELRMWKAGGKKGEGTIREAEKRMIKRVHELAKELLATSRDFLDQDADGIPLSEIDIDADDQFREMEIQRLRLLSHPNADPKEVALLEEQLNQRLHELAVEEKGNCREFLNPYSHGIPKEFIKLNENPNFLREEAELRRLRKGDTPESAMTQIYSILQKLADDIAEEQVKGDRKRYLHIMVGGVEIEDIPLDSDPIYTDLEVNRAILVAKDPLVNQSKITELEAKLNARAADLLSRQIQHERKGYIPSEAFRIPVDEIPLNTDEYFLSLEAERRRRKRAGTRDAVMEINEKLRKRAHELGEEVVAQDLSMLRETYHNIPKAELHLHSDHKFRELANKRRWRKGKSKMGSSHEIAQIEAEMDQRAEELAAAMVEAERVFLDPNPEGMGLEDVPLNTDATFHQMEAEYHRRLQHPTNKQLDSVLRELREQMNARVHFLARLEFEKRRGFLDPEPRGIPLADLGLDEDPEFKEHEIALYRFYKNPRAMMRSPTSQTELEERMSARVFDIARAVLAEDLRFLDQDPEGVPLEKLRLEEDEEFTELARDRRRRRKGLKNHLDHEKVALVEEKMNQRAHEIAKQFLHKERCFLPTEPEGIPLASLPLGTDKEFHRLEKLRLMLKGRVEPRKEKLKEVETALIRRCEALAREMHHRERTFLDQEPMGILLDELPLNEDEVLKPLEAERREMLQKPKRYVEDLRKLEDLIADRVQEIVRQYITEERSFMDPEPMGVPLRYLPLNSDSEFHALEMELRKLQRQKPAAAAAGGSEPQRNSEAINRVKRKMDLRAKALAKELVEKGRRFLDPEPLGVPIADVPLNGDELFRHLEEQRRALKQDSKANSAQIKTLEQRLNDRAAQLAKDLLNDERAFLKPCPFGIPLPYLPLNENTGLRDLERQRRRLRKDLSSQQPEKAAQIAALEEKIEQRVLEMAHEELANDRDYLAPEPCGVPLQHLDLNEDAEFHRLEVERYNLKRRGRFFNQVARLEELLNERVAALANELLSKERYYLVQSPEGIPLEKLPLDTDPEFHRMELERRSILTSGKRQRGNLELLEEKMNMRVQELALEMRGWQDKAFHEANRHVAERWPRVGLLFPEGSQCRILPGAVSGVDVTSVPGDAGYLAPFIAALSLHPILLKRLLITVDHPISGPYTFVFFDPNSNAVHVDIDDRVPCDGDGNPKFMLSTRRSWFPLLLEKAYAKFVGGYQQLDNCTPHETLRDLTGRPVTHIPLDKKLAKACNIGDFETIEFWLEIKEAMSRGDVFMCMSRKGKVVEEDGIHPLCCYAVLGVLEIVEPEEGKHGPRGMEPTKRSTSNSGRSASAASTTGSCAINRGGGVSANEPREAPFPIDIIIKLHNAYRGYPPEYTGPLSADDPRWNDDIRRQCQCDCNRQDVLLIPLSAFLRYFSSVQRCHINCGDRLTATGMWDKTSAGGTPKFTSFRQNPIFLVENKSTRPSTILAEVRHHTPFSEDEDGTLHYPSSGISLLQPLSQTVPPTPLLTNSTHRFLQKGVMLDSREVCYVMELPPSSTSCIVPYTKKPGTLGSFSLSIYPGMAKVTLTPLLQAGLSKQPLSQSVLLTPGNPGERVDLYVSEATDVHILLRQDKVTDSRLVAHGDIVAEDDVAFAAFTEEGVQIANSGVSTNAREHSLLFQAKQSGRFPIMMVCPNPPTSGDCPCTLQVFLKRGVKGKLTPSPNGAPPINFFYMPRIPAALKSHSRSRKDHYASGTNADGTHSKRNHHSGNNGNGGSGEKSSKTKRPYLLPVLRTEKSLEGDSTPATKASSSSGFSPAAKLPSREK